MGDFSPLPGSRAGGFVRFLSAVGNTTGIANFATGGRSVNYSGGGIVSVGFSSSTLIISASSATSQGLSAIGNTAGLTSSQSNAITALTVSGAGGVSVGYSNSTMVISGAVSATSQGLFALGNTTALTSSQTNALTALSFSATGGLSVGYSNNTVVFSGATSATSQGLFALGNTTALTSSQTNALTALSISATGGVSVGYSNNTVIISAPPANNLFIWEPLQLNTAASSTLSMSTSTGGSRNNYVMGYDLQQPLVFNVLRLIGSFTMSGLTLATSSKATSTTGSAGCTLSVVLYSNVTTGGASQSMTSFTSTTLGFSISGSLTASSSSYTQNLTINWVTAGLGANSTTLSTTTTASTSVYSSQPAGTSSFTGFRPIDVNWNVQTIGPANIAVNIAASHVVAGGMSFSPSPVGMVNTLTILGMGAFSTNASFYPNLGIQSNSATMLANFPFYGPSTMSSNFRAYVQFVSL